MLIHLIRHAHAGSRRAWVGDDSTRPLSARGEAQALAIGEALADAGIDRLWTSPYLRCEQTLVPLAGSTGARIEPSAFLAEGAGGATALAHLLACAADGHTVAACSHGDVIPAIIATAVGQGAHLHGPVAPRKASRYTLEVTDGRLTEIRYVPRPEVDVQA